jgi:hypothetical protein
VFPICTCQLMHYVLYAGREVDVMFIVYHYSSLILKASVFCQSLPTAFACPIVTFCGLFLQKEAFLFPELFSALKLILNQ